MPYRNLLDLPSEVRGALPEEAQKRYAAAFNMAWERYRNFEHTRMHASREELARRCAWQDVERAYEKDTGTGVWSPRAHA